MSSKALISVYAHVWTTMVLLAAVALAAPAAQPQPTDETSLESLQSPDMGSVYNENSGSGSICSVM